MMAIEGRNGVVQLADHYAIIPAAGEYDDVQELGPEPQYDEGNGVTNPGSVPGPVDCDAPAVLQQQIQIASPIPARSMPTQRQYLPAQRHGRGVDFLQSLQQHPSRGVQVRSNAIHLVDDAPQRFRDDSAFTFSVTAALRDRRDEATPVIMAELKQMLDKRVHTHDLSKKQRSAIIRSSMFLDKYLASGAFERFKARLVDGGNQQDKGLYEDLFSPTVATSSVLAIAAIAAAESRKVIAIDIGLNADIHTVLIDWTHTLVWSLSSLLWYTIIGKFEACHSMSCSIFD
jgi:hypothetical protein